MDTTRDFKVVLLGEGTRAVESVEAQAKVGLVKESAWRIALAAREKEPSSCHRHSR